MSKIALYCFKIALYFGINIDKKPSVLPKKPVVFAVSCYKNCFCWWQEVPGLSPSALAFSNSLLCIMITHLVRLYPTLQYEIILSSILLPGDNMKPLKEKVSITIDTPVLEKIRYLAEQDDRPLSSYINLVLREHLEKLKNK